MTKEFTGRDTLEIEKFILSSVMINPDRWYPLARKQEITPEHFGSKQHADIWRLLSDRLNNGDSINCELLLRQEPERVEEVGGHQALGPLAGGDELPTNDLFSQYCGEIKKASLTKVGRQQVAKIANDLEIGLNPISEFKEFSVTMEGLEELDGNKSSLVDKAYSMSFNANDPPPRDESCLYLGSDHAVAARGNITVIQGKQKAGKSAVVSSVLGAVIRGNYSAQGDVFEFNWVGDCNGAIIHFDTEQSPEDWHSLVTRSLARSGLSGEPDRLVSVPAVTFSITDRLTALEGIMERERKRLGSIDTILLDGVADLCKSPNDEAESNDLIARLHGLSHEFNCAILGVLHENPGSETGKTRGHLGSQLGRKAFSNIRVDKDPESQVSTIYGTDMRKRDLPKKEGFCFAWDNSIKMHAFQGRHAGLAAAERDRKNIEKAREYWEPIFERASESGTNGNVPPLSVKEIIDLEWDMGGTKKKSSVEAMRKKIQRHRELGVIRKTENNTYVLNPSGTSGTFGGTR